MDSVSRRIVIGSLVLATACWVGCKDAEVETDATDAQDTVEQDTVELDTIGQAASESEPAPQQTIRSPDLAFYPMPADPPGQDYVASGVQMTPQIAQSAGPNECPIHLKYDGVNTKVTITSYNVNCCTESIQPAVVVGDGVVEIRIYEYMPDVCECRMLRSLRFQLTGFDPTGMEFRVYANAGEEPCTVMIDEG